MGLRPQCRMARSMPVRSPQLHPRSPEPMDLLKRTSALSLLLALALPLAACGGDDAQTPADEDDLTSLTARQRNLVFDGYVYVPATASDYEIQSKIRLETKSAF